jgi:hypothetical protein
VWLRSASEVYDLSMYHLIGFGDPDPHFHDPRILVNESLRLSVFHRPTGSETAAPKSVGNETPLLQLRPLQGATSVARRTFELPLLAPLTVRSEDHAAGRPGPEAEAGNSHGVWCPYDA